MKKALTDYFAPSANYRYARWRLSLVKHEQGETMASFLVRARNLANNCELARPVSNRVDDALVDLAITKCNSDKLR